MSPRVLIVLVVCIIVIIGMSIILVPSDSPGSGSMDAISSPTRRSTPLKTALDNTSSTPTSNFPHSDVSRSLPPLENATAISLASSDASQRRLPDERNGYLKLIEATQALEPLSQEDQMILMSVTLDVPAEHIERARGILLRNASALQILQEAVNLGLGESPPITSFDQELPEVGLFVLLANMVSARSVISAIDGSLDASLADRSLQTAMGQLIITSSNSLVQVLVGMSCFNRGQDGRMELIGSRFMPRERLEGYAGDLRVPHHMEQDITSAFQRSVSGERDVSRKEFARIEVEGWQSTPFKLLFEPWSKQRGPEGDIARDIATRASSDPTFFRRHYNAAKTQEAYDRIMSLLDKTQDATTYAEALPYLLAAEDVVAALQSSHAANMATQRQNGYRGTSNILGSHLLLGLIPSHKAILKQRFQSWGYIRALRIQTACSMHAALYGQLPATLTDLLPQFMDAVPLDPWNGREPSYMRDKSLLRFVGPNLKDDGGTDDDQDYRLN